MHGHLFVLFRPKDVGVDPSLIPKKEDQGEWGVTRRKQVEELLRPSPLAGFTVAEHYGQDDFLTYDGSKFIVRLNLAIDPRHDKLFLERAAYVGKEHTVEIHAWVSVDRTRSDRLTCGSWRSEDETAGVTTTNDPSKDDRTRMNITVFAPSIAAAREALIATLTGDKRPTKPWIV